MKVTGFQYSVSAVVELTGHELSDLCDLSQRHYDGKCRKASELGGFLYGMCQQFYGHLACPGFIPPQDFCALSNDELSYVVQFTLDMDKIDIIRKILESGNFSGVVPHGSKQRVTGLWLGMGKAFNDCRRERDRLEPATVKQGAMADSSRDDNGGDFI